MTYALGVAGAALGAVVLVHAGLWALLSIVALPRPRSRPIQPGSESIAVIIPAHNEEELVGITVRSVRQSAAVHRGLVRVIVVADNCTDATAATAADHGAEVFERNDPRLRGKSFALEHAIAAIRGSEVVPHIVAFVDADTTVSPSFLPCVAQAIRDGAGVVQVHYAAGSGEEPVRRLRRLAFALVHWSRPLGLARLGLGTSLKGNGMAYRWDLLEDGIGGSGVTEDAAMSLDLARRGIPVRFEPRATVQGYMSGDWGSATVQDRRWESGKLQLYPRAMSAFAHALSSPRALGGPLEVAAMPLSLVVTGWAAAEALTLATDAPAWHVHAAGAAIAVYVSLGWVAARVSPMDLRALSHAPLFVAHKLRIVGGALLRREAQWVRTSRRPEETR